MSLLRDWFPFLLWSMFYGTYRFYVSWSAKKRRIAPFMDALRLMILPAQAPWPKAYLNAIRRSGTKQTVTLSLDQVIADVRNGIVQFRDPAKHLKELFLKGRVALTDEFSIELVARNTLIASFVLWRTHDFRLWSDMKVAIPSRFSFDSYL